MVLHTNTINRAWKRDCHSTCKVGVLVNKIPAVVLTHFLDFTLKPKTAESQGIHPQNASVVIIETEKGILHVESLPPVIEELRGAVRL
jgi:hypothetical protein